MSWLDEQEAICRAATPGRLDLGIWEASSDNVARFADHLKHGSGDVWLVWSLDHPMTRLGDDPKRPEHAVTIAITGNGPNSEANARAIKAAMESHAWALAMLREYRDLLCGLVTRAEHECDLHGVGEIRRLIAKIDAGPGEAI